MIFKRRKKERAHVDGFLGDVIYGWHHSERDGEVLLRIDSKIVYNLKKTIQRPDVKLALGLVSDLVGFECYIPESYFDGSKRKIEILQIISEVVVVVHVCDLVFEDRRSRATNIERQPIANRAIRRAAVVCWDLAHNPAGRAYVLHQILSKSYDEVDLIGPLIPRFGDDTWKPIRGLGINIINRRVENLSDLSSFAKEITEIKYDFVWACKPRFPGVYLALHLQESSGCRIALDIDDYEMSFFSDKNNRVLEADPIDKLNRGQIHIADFDATALTHKYIENFCLRTVSNVSLQRAYGGEIVPHSRDEHVFDPRKFDKITSRVRHNIAPESNVVVFIGTIRRHKGIIDVAEAVANTPDINTHLLVAGAFEGPELRSEIVALLGDRVTILNDVPFESLPELINLGDFICLPQDPLSETSQFQLPAKVMDGLAMGLKVILQDLPTYDIIKKYPGIFIRQHDEDWSQALRRASSDKSCDKESIRSNFVKLASASSLSIKMNAYFSTVARENSLIRPDDVFEGLLGRTQNHSAPRFLTSSSKSRTKDLVVLWKQHDSGLFGRRVDMMAKYLLKNKTFDRVIILDSPMNAWDFQQIQSRSAAPGLSNARLLHDSIVKKFHGESIDGTMYRKVFITSEKGEQILGRSLSRRQDLHRDINSYFSDIGLSKEAMLWSCPIVSHLEDVLQAHSFRKHIVDLIDDEREFATSDASKNEKNAHYQKIIKTADIVITNNHVMKDRFDDLAGGAIAVIENGVERKSFDNNEIMKLESLSPSSLVLGYVGNLRDRIDVELIKEIANEDEKFEILLVGPTGGNKDIESLRSYKNIHLTGAVTYEHSRRIAAGFDIALIPHKVDRLTDSMNPLKFFLYRELSLPIVSTPIKNLGSIDSSVFISKDSSHVSFIEALRLAVLHRSRKHLPSNRHKVVEDFYWENRAARVADLLVS